MSDLSVNGGDLALKTAFSIAPLADHHHTNSAFNCDSRLFVLVLVLSHRRYSYSTRITPSSTSTISLSTSTIESKTRWRSPSSVKKTHVFCRAQRMVGHEERKPASLCCTVEWEQCAVEQFYHRYAFQFTRSHGAASCIFGEVKFAWAWS